ncbi:MAG TPA: response regulator, partial [Acidimicrobiales bacterium]|nr:response regulator [Acidimicrobiales bacterium]
MATQSAFPAPGTGAGAPTLSRPSVEGHPVGPRWTRDHSVPISVAVVDGQAVFRAGLAGILEEDDRIAVVATSEGNPGVGALCAELAIDVVVTDLSFSQVDGIELIRGIAAASPSTKVLVVAGAAD